jgi:SAM-dependent methyltransferase
MDPSPDGTPLYEQSPTTRFSDRVHDYVRFRPTYPPAAIDAALAGLGEPSRLTVADIGAGTGISSRPLADRGVRVIAVEPNREMSAAADAHHLVTFVEGTAEATLLESQSVDLVLCAQAFHWFRAAEALEEFRRILRPGGRVALVWNLRDESDPFTAGYTNAIRTAIGGEPSETRKFDPAILPNAGFESAALHVFAHSQALDLPAVIGRALSASYSPKAGPKHATLVDDLKRAHALHANPDGLVTIRYQTRVHTAGRAC